MSHTGSEQQTRLRIQTSAPGRICLFGEHQDYLGLPVIAAAIDLRVTIEAVTTDDLIFKVSLPDIGEQHEYDPQAQLVYTHGRDYLPAAINVLRRAGVRWESGFHAVVRGDIPINSGTSSSSALLVSWCALLLAAGGDARAQDPMAVATFAHAAEVTEFQSPGGMMDHFSTAVGGAIWLDCRPPYRVEQLSTNLGDFVLVDSGIPKDTNGLLDATRQKIESLPARLGLAEDAAPEPPPELFATMNEEQRPLLIATWRNRALTEEAREAFRRNASDEEIGTLLLRHHEELAQRLGTSHPTIDQLIVEGIDAGALGAKINGSGGGGSFFFYAPRNAAAIRSHFRAKGYRAWIVRIGKGLESKIEPMQETAP